MKSFDRPSLRFVLLCFALLGVAGFAALCWAADRSGTVTIKDDVILIHPGTKLTQEDREQLNEVLSSYDKSLYKVQTYKSGKLTRTIGQLSDVLIDQALASEVADAAAKGNSSRTLQIIAATTSQQVVASTTEQQPPGASPGASTNPLRGPGTPTPTPPPNAVPSASTNPLRGPGTPTPTPPPNAVPSASTNPLRGPGTPTPTPPPNAVPSASTNPLRGRGTPTPTPPPNAIPSASTNPQKHPPAVGEKAARELIERLKPILEKYSNSKK